MKEVTCYTDGACRGNPGPGGWACILMYKSTRKEISGFEGHTTNNRMELLAVINALRELKEPCRVGVFSDSAYVVNALEKGWTAKWAANKWMTAAGEAVKNQDLWEELLRLAQIHEVKLCKVAGHADNEDNNRCDMLAKAEIKDNAPPKAARTGAKKPPLN